MFVKSAVNYSDTARNLSNVSLLTKLAKCTINIALKLTVSVFLKIKELRRVCQLSFLFSLRSFGWKKKDIKGTCHLLEAGRAGTILCSRVNFFYALPQFPAEKNVTLLLVRPKIVMTLPKLKDMRGIIKRDILVEKETIASSL